MPIQWQMPPCSHLLPINDHVTDNQAGQEGCGSSRGLHGDRSNLSKSKIWSDAELRRNRLLAISSNIAAAEIPGQDTREPAFDAPAKWIASETQGQAIVVGYTVVDPTSLLVAHLAEAIKENANEFLSTHDTKRLIDRLSESHPKQIDELIPKLMSFGEVQKVLQQLLQEQVSLGTIPETLVETASFNKNLIALVEVVRHALGRAVTRRLLDEGGELKVVTPETAIED